MYRNFKTFEGILDILEQVESAYKQEVKPSQAKETFIEPKFTFKGFEDKNVVYLDAVGYSKEEIDIDYESSTSMLTIKGKLTDENKEKFQYLTSVHKDFQKKFKTTVAVDEDKISAEFVNGVVIVTIPFLKKDNKKIKIS